MNDLKILGPRDSGRGILVEYDAGFVNPNEKRNLDLINESKNFLDHSKPFEFYAVLQKYNTPNRNGRIYPERIFNNVVLPDPVPPEIRIFVFAFTNPANNSAISFGVLTTSFLQHA